MAIRLTETFPLTWSQLTKQDKADITPQMAEQLLRATDEVGATRTPVKDAYVLSSVSKWVKSPLSIVLMPQAMPTLSNTDFLLDLPVSCLDAVAYMNRTFLLSFPQTAHHDTGKFSELIVTLISNSNSALSLEIIKFSALRSPKIIPVPLIKNTIRESIISTALLDANINTTDALSKNTTEIIELINIAITGMSALRNTDITSLKTIYLDKKDVEVMHF